MPAPISWTLIGGPLPAVPVVDATVTGVAELPPLISSFTQQEVLDLFDRLFPLHWLQTLKAPGPGWEVFQAYAMIAKRASEAVARLGEDGFFSSSYAGSRATGTVELYRDSPNGEGIDVTVKAGTVVTTSKGGRDFVTTEDAIFISSILGPLIVGVRAVADGYAWNVPGQTITADGTSLLGDIDTIKTLVEEPALGDLTIRVRQFVVTAGGRAAALDQLGQDRGIIRAEGESDASYRGRVRVLPDTVTPDAITRTCKRALDSLGVSFSLIETFEPSYQTCWDAPGVSYPDASYSPTTFVFDDPDSTVPFLDRWMDESDYRGGVIVVVGACPPLADYGLTWDDVAPYNATALVDPVTGGKRAVSAWDAPTTLVADFGYLVGAVDGYDAPKRALYKGLNDTLQSMKAAGTQVALELLGE